MGLLLGRATCTGHRYRESKASTLQELIPTCKVHLPSHFPHGLLPYVNYWSQMTDNQPSDHPGLLGSLKLWDYLQIWAFFWRECTAFTQLSVVSVIPWSLESHRPHGFGWSVQTPWCRTDISKSPVFFQPLLVEFLPILCHWGLLQLWLLTWVTPEAFQTCKRVFKPSQPPISSYCAGLTPECHPVSLFMTCSSH